ncbi:Ig-like domain-containing protein, partial [Thorsellia kenyensis]
GYTDDKRPDIEGRAPDGVVEVAIYLGNDLIGRVPVVNNSWTYNFAKDLTEGKQTISVAPVNYVGTIGDKTSLSFTVETEVPPALSQQFLDLYDDFGPKTGSVKRGESTDDRQPEFKGTAGGKIAFIKIYDNGKEVAVVPVNEDGTWSYIPAANLAGGEHNFQAAPMTKSGV